MNPFVRLEQAVGYPIAHAVDWRSHAVCRDAPAEVFTPQFVSAAAALEAWKGWCSRCPVSRECLITAIRDGENNDIWAGTTPAQRLQIEPRVLHFQTTIERGMEIR